MGLRVMWRGFVLSVLLAAGLLLNALGAGCSAERGDTTGQTNSQQLKIVATVGMVADVVRAVAGDRAEVSVLIGEGLDPHLYRPTRSDLARVLAADAVFLNGLVLEGRLIEALERNGSESGRPVFAIAEQLPTDKLLKASESGKVYDPHVWMDPSAWTMTIDVVRDALAELDPEGAEAFDANAAAYAQRLQELDAYAEGVLSSVASEQRVLVTAHDAFGYFGRRYGFEVLGIQGISTQSEAGVRDIERLVSVLVERRVGAVFVESTVSDRNIRALIDGAAAQGHTVVIGGELFSDAMGEAGTYEGTYVGMIDHNVTMIARSLGGEAPEGGMSGRLSR